MRLGCWGFGGERVFGAENPDKRQRPFGNQPTHDPQTTLPSLQHSWSSVAKRIPGRTGQQCAQRWRHRVNPTIRKDKWTPAEDDELAALVSARGPAWADIARALPGRTDHQCMGRWRRHLDPSIRRDGWSSGEDATLTALVTSLGSRWAAVSRAFDGRTAQQCRARWFQLGGGRAAQAAPAAPAESEGGGESRGGGCCAGCFCAATGCQAHHLPGHPRPDARQGARGGGRDGGAARHRHPQLCRPPGRPHARPGRRQPGP